MTSLDKWALDYEWATGQNELMTGYVEWARDRMSVTEPVSD